MTITPQIITPQIITVLDAAWTLQLARAAPDAPALTAMGATVPGCTHTDLLAHGLITDPFVGTNEIDVAWVAACDWTYRCEFDVGDAQLAHEHLDLVCDGLDTLAEIRLNGHLVGATENMHRRYRFDVRHAVMPGPNALEITFRSATEHAEALRSAHGDWPSSSFGRPFNYIRKMACSWGWDWGPWLTSAGIWRDISLVAWSGGRIGDVRPTASVDSDGVGTLVVNADTVISAANRSTSLLGPSLRIEVRSPDGSLVGTCSTSVSMTATTEFSAAASLRVGTTELRLDDELALGKVELWWPHTYGSQPLYQLDVDLIDSDGALLDHRSHRIGFRSVELDTTPDRTGSAFTFVVNGRPIFVRGVNWVPDDVFPTRITEGDYRERLEQAVAANVDMIRVWGGGIYEDTRFYEACDELGLMVWQDFLFACAAYPEHLLADEVEAEARDNVSRLMRHPSLVVWNGNNENIWGAADWGWHDTLQGRSWGADFYHRLLPKIVAELDPHRLYWPGSPYSGSENVAPNADSHGCVHVWDVWNQLDFTRYRDHTPRFVAEFGWQAPPAWTTMADHVAPDEFVRTSPAMRNHQKATDGDLKLDRAIVPRFGHIESLDAWWYAAQLTQARAVQTGIEHFRSLRPYCMGTIWWQLNDCWPVASWAVIDGLGRPKPSWFALREAYRSRLLTVVPRGDVLAVVAVNETNTDWTVATHATRYQLDGTIAASSPVEFLVPACGSVQHVLPWQVTTAIDPTAEVLTIGDQHGDHDERAWWWYAPDRDLAIQPSPVTWSTALDDDAVVVTATAAHAARDVSILPDRLGPLARVDRQMISMLPGQTEQFRITGLEKPGELDPTRLDESKACWSVADIIHPPSLVERQRSHSDLTAI